MGGVPYWKIITENQHTFNGTEEKTDSLKLSTLKNHTLACDLTQIQVVSFKCNHFFYLKAQGIKYGLNIILISVCFC
jgi:SUMO ligase MMS21 Smc5/6 complex component